jgi:hypothetical protein
MKTVSLLLAAVSLGLVATGRADTTIDPVNRYAWGANIGFTDWRPSPTDGVDIGISFCAGYIYAANVGWIKMGAGTTANGTAYSNASPDDFGVNCSAGATGEKNLRGFAYGANIGWVNFQATGNPRVVLATGQLRGFGVIITGDDPSLLVVRAIGPSLGGFGVPNPLNDPFLELRNQNGTLIREDNNWRDTQEFDIQNTGLAPGNNLESAILISVAPGNYTAIVKGADGGIGNGLVKVYKLLP